VPDRLWQQVVQCAAVIPHVLIRTACAMRHEMTWHLALVVLVTDQMPWWEAQTGCVLYGGASSCTVQQSLWV